MLARALPDHRLGRVLGQGQFGVVWSAQHLHLARTVAVKRLSDEVAADPAHLARFRREARTLAQLDHKHVVAVHDYREVDGLRLLIIELLSGGTLTDRRSRGMPAETAIAATLAAASGLHHVHRRNVLHRDVKPENLMFDGEGVLKVTDFGVARGDALTETTVEVTKAGMFFGTPAYVAPEQAAVSLAKGWPEVSPRSDQYSLAAVLYELLSGELTHDPSGGGISLCVKRMNEEARPLGEITDKASSGVCSVVMRALSRDPASRFTSTEEFGVELAEATSTSLGQGWLARSAVQIREPGPILDAADPHDAPNRASTAPVAVGHAGTQPDTTGELGTGGVGTGGVGTGRAGSRARRALTALAVGVLMAALGLGGYAVLARSESTGADSTASTATTAVVAPEELPIEVSEIWSAPTGGNVFSSPAVDGDLVVVGSEDGSVYGLAASDGAQRWRYDTGMAVRSSPVLTSGLAFIGSDDGSLHAIDLADGAEKWSAPIGYEIVSTPATTDDGLVLVGADGLYAFDVATGEQRWRGELDSVTVSSPVIEGDTVMIGTSGGKLYAFGLDGAQKWSVDLGDAISSRPAAADGVAHVSVADGTLHALDLTDGSEVFSEKLADGIVSSPLVTDGRVVVGTRGATVVALDATDGSRDWTWQGPAGDWVDSSPAAGDGWVAVGIDEGSVVLLDLTTGELVGRARTGGPVKSSPVVSGDTVYVGSTDDAVHAFRVGESQADG